MNCEACQDALIDFSFGEFGEPGDPSPSTVSPEAHLENQIEIQIAGHLATCPDCALEYCRLVADLRGIRAAHDDVAPGPEIRAAVRAKVAQIVARPWWHRLLTPLSTRVPLYGALMAAAIPVVLWLASMRSSGTQAAAPTAPVPTPPSVQRYDATRTPTALQHVL